MEAKQQTYTAYARFPFAYHFQPASLVRFFTYYWYGATSSTSIRDSCADRTL